MVTMEKLKEFSKKSEEDLKKEIAESLERLKPIQNMPDEQKVAFVMNELFAKYSKKEFGMAKTYVKGFFVGHSRRFNNAESIRKDTEDFIKQQPENAKKMNMADTNGNLLYYETQQKFETMEDWQIKKKFKEVTAEEAETENIIPVLSKGGKHYIGKEIPLEDYVIQHYGFYQDKDNNWIQFVKKSTYTVMRDDKKKDRKDNTLEIMPDFQFGEFPVFKVDSQSNDTFSYFTDSGASSFKFERAMEDKEVEEIITTNQDKTILLSDFNKFSGNVKRNTFVIIKTRVQDIGLTDNDTTVLKVFDDSLNLGAKDEKGERVTPISVYPPETFKPMFGDGAEITIFGNPYTSAKGVKTISAYGIYASSIYKNVMPKPEAVAL